MKPMMLPEVISTSVKIANDKFQGHTMLSGVRPSTCFLLGLRNRII